jgi:hypothetical protein
MNRYVECFICKNKKGFIMLNFTGIKENSKQKVNNIKHLGFKPVCGECYRNLQLEKSLKGTFETKVEY